MADTKISALTSISSDELTDTIEIPAAHNSTANRKLALAEVRELGWEIITDHGAGTGETAATNTTAIHAARDASGAETVYFPPGTFSVNALTANVAGQTWHLAAGCTLSLAASQNTHVISVGAADVTIEGEGWQSVIDQNSASQTAGNGIDVDTAARCTVRNIKITDCDNDGIEVINTSPDFEADHVKVDGYGQYGGITVNGNGGSDRAYIHDCHITNGPSSGDSDAIGIHGNTSGGTVHGCRVQNNYLEVDGADMFGIEIGPFGGVSPVERAIVTGNLIMATADCFGGISMDTCEGAVVCNNTYDQNGQTGSNAIGGIELPKGEECQVVGNRIIGDSELHHPISVDQASRNTIIGNTIQGWRNSGGNLNGGITVTTSTASWHCNDNVIANNIFIHPSSTITAAGIALQVNNASSEVQRNVIKGNIFVGSNVASSEGIHIQHDAGTMDYLSISDNIFYNLPIGITGGSGAGTHSRLGPNMFDTVTTPYDNSDAIDISGHTRGVEFIIDGGGSAITTGEKGHMGLPFDGYIISAQALADQSGSITVDIWKDTYANFPPTNADSITASAPVTITSSTKSEDETLTGWTRSFNKGDVLAYNVDSATTVERVTIVLLALELA